ncbi:unnamed protein product [Rhizophagus irregularis]|nr:unnamed protein product [Rhizophagus irregularis]
MTNNSNSKFANTIVLTQWLEGAVTENYINYCDYSEFKKIQFINNGAFGDVYRAIWKKSENSVVALKAFENNKTIIKEIVNEIKLMHKVNFHTNIIRFFGITKRKDEYDMDSNYLLILEYADSGTLGNYLKENFNKLDWSIKLQFAIQTADAVSYIHQHDIIHCDLHSDNILVHQNMIKLADFGLSRRLAEVSTRHDIIGKVAYIDPQNYNMNNNYHYKPNKKSDVYSVGVLLWEISSGRTPFESYSDNYQRIALMLEIPNGKRETPVSDTPSDYIDIYTKCWQNNPDDRSSMQQVFSGLKLIKLNTSEMEICETTTRIIKSDVMHIDECSINVDYSSHIKLEENEKYDKMQVDEKLTTSYNLNNIEIIDEILLLYENSIQNGIYKDNIIQLIKQYIILKNENENRIYKYLLDNKSRQQNTFLLAIFYYHGIGTGKDNVAAFELYKEAAEKGVINAIYNLGYCYENGIGIEKDEYKAFGLYKEAAKKGQDIAINME